MTPFDMALILAVFVLVLAVLCAVGDALDRSHR